MGPKQVLWFQEFLAMIVPIKHKNHADNNQNNSSLFAVIIISRIVWQIFSCCCFVNSSELSQLFTAHSSDVLTNQQQNDNKKILTKWFQYFTGMILNCTDYHLSEKFLCFIGTILESLNLLGTIVFVFVG